MGNTPWSVVISVLDLILPGKYNAQGSVDLALNLTTGKIPKPTAPESNFNFTEIKQMCTDILSLLLEYSSKNKQQLNINTSNPISGETMWHVLARYDGERLKQVVLEAESYGFKVDLEARYVHQSAFNIIGIFMEKLLFLKLYVIQKH